MDKYFDDKVCKWNTDFTWPRLLKREVWPCRKEATGGKRIKASFGETVGILMEYECACIFNCTLHLQLHFASFSDGMISSSFMEMALSCGTRDVSYLSLF